MLRRFAPCSNSKVYTDGTLVSINTKILRDRMLASRFVDVGHRGWRNRSLTVTSLIMRELVV